MSKPAAEGIKDTWGKVKSVGARTTLTQKKKMENGGSESDETDVSKRMAEKKVKKVNR